MRSVIGNIYTSPPAASGGVAVLDTGDIDGLKASWVSATQISIGVGSCRSDDDTEDIVVAATLTATITSTGANGRNVDTAEQANKWYALCVIKNPTTSTVAAFLINQDDLGGFTFPAGYTVKRRVAWVRNDASSNLRKTNFKGRGKHRTVFYDVNAVTYLQALSSGSATSYTNVDVSEWLPPTSTRGFMSIYITPPLLIASLAYIRPDGSSSASTSVFFSHYDDSSNGSEFETNASQVFEYQVNSSGTDLDIWILSYYDEV